MASKQLAVTLDEQIGELKREIAMRERAYRKWISNGTLRHDDAVKQLARMKAALETLQQAADMYATKLEMQRLKSVFVDL